MLHLCCKTDTKELKNWKCLHKKLLTNLQICSKPDLLTPKLQITHYKNFICATYVYQNCKYFIQKLFFDKSANVFKQKLFTKLQIIHYKNLFCATKFAKC